MANGNLVVQHFAPNIPRDANNDDGIVDMDVPQNVPLAKLIPIKETFQFDYAVMTHHNKTE